MRIAIASGKGGTGKTTIATSVALALVRAGRAAQLIDCDVEEPNSHLYIHPAIEKTIAVDVMAPMVDQTTCTHCGACAEFCRFNALASLPDQTLVFPELCHSCTGCVHVCPEKAIAAIQRTIGSIEIGHDGKLIYAAGRLNVGEARATPIIAALDAHIDADRVTILDAPPGSSCPVVETLRISDFCLLVAEPTPFGLADLEHVAAVAEAMKIPRAALINRDGMGDDRVERFLEEKGVPLLMKIPNDRRIAERMAGGTALIDVRPELAPPLLDLVEKIERLSREAS